MLLRVQGSTSIRAGSECAVLQWVLQMPFRHDREELLDADTVAKLPLAEHLSPAARAFITQVPHPM